MTSKVLETTHRSTANDAVRVIHQDPIDSLPAFHVTLTWGPQTLDSASEYAVMTATLTAGDPSVDDAPGSANKVPDSPTLRSTSMPVGQLRSRLEDEKVEELHVPDIQILDLHEVLVEIIRMPSSVRVIVLNSMKFDLRDLLANRLAELVVVLSKHAEAAPLEHGRQAR